jgi:hypothetical protein
MLASSDVPHGYRHHREAPPGLHLMEASAWNARMVHEPKRASHLLGVDADVLPAGRAGLEVHQEHVVHGPVVARRAE